MMVNATNDLKTGAVNIEQLEGYMDPLIKKMKQLGVDTTEVENALMQFKDGKGSIEQIQKALEITRKSTRQFANDLKNSLQQMNVSSEYIDKIYQAALHAADGFTELQKRTVLSSQSFQVAETAFSKFTGILKSSLSGFSSFVQGASTAVMGISMLKNAIDTINNPDISGWEKFSSVLMSLGMGIPMVMNGITVFKDVIDKIRASTGLLNTVEAANLALKEKHITVSMASILAAKGLNEEEKKGHIIRLLTKAGIEEETAAKIADAAATEGLTGAMKALKAEILTSLSGLGLIIAVLAIAAIALTVHLVKISSEAYKAQQELNQAQATANSLTEHFNKTKESYDNLKSSLADYNEAQKGLNKLKAGTAEWTEAVSELNSQVLDLLQKYPELSKYVTNTGNQLIISQRGQQEILKKQMEEVSSANLLRLSSQEKVNSAKLRVEKEDTRQKIKVGTSGTEGDIKSTISQSVFNAVVNAVQKSNGAILQNASSIGSIDGVNGNLDLINAISKNKASLLQLNDTINTTDNTNQLLNTQIGEEIIATSDLNGTIKAAIGKTDIPEEIAEEYNSALENNKIALGNKYDEITYGDQSEFYTGHTATADDMISALGTGTAFGNYIMDQYMKLVDPSVLGVKDYKKDGTIEYQYTGDDNQVTTGTMTADAIFEAVAQAMIDMQSLQEQATTRSQEEFRELYPEAQESYDKMMSGQGSSNQQVIDSVLDSADWSDPVEAIKTIQEQLSLIGIAVDPNALAAYAEQMHKINENATSGVANVTEAKVNADEKARELMGAEEAASKGEIGAEELANAKQAYMDAAQALEQSVEDNIDAEVETLDLDAEAVEDMADYIKDNADSMKGVNKNIKDSQSAVKELAKEIVRADRASS